MKKTVGFRRLGFTVAREARVPRSMSLFVAVASSVPIQASARGGAYVMPGKVRTPGWGWAARDAELWVSAGEGQGHLS